MLQIFFTVALSAVPLIMCIPPMRSLNLFVQNLEGFFRESYTNTLYSLARLVGPMILDFMLCSGI